MADYKSIYMRYMDENGIKYSDVRERVVRVSYSGDNLKSIPVYVYFSENDEPRVRLACSSIAHFEDNKLAAGLIACNELNRKYRWVKFYVDEENDIIAEDDAIIDATSCGPELRELVVRMVDIIDKGYPTIMQAKWK